ncbi:MAG: DUF3784 domain-containing protein [Bacillota bacterium]
MTLALFHLFMALFLVLLGCLIKYGKSAWLIAGYNTSSKKVKEQYDLEALCRGVGHLLFALAGTLIIPAAGGFFNTAWAIHLGWILFALTTIFFLIYANTGNRYRNN